MGIRLLVAIGSENRLNYRFETCSAPGPEVDLNIPNLGGIRRYVSFVSNDCLGFFEHPLVKKAAIFGIENYGTGMGTSPAISGHFDFHKQLEEKIAGFFQPGSAIVYTTGYTANSSTLLAILIVSDGIFYISWWPSIAVPIC
jgi:glycine C-acetyltransferase